MQSFVRRRSFTLCFFALVLCGWTILIYHPVWHAGFIWDDDRYVTDNPLLTAPDGLRRIWFSLDAPSQYFPLSYTVLMIGRSLWGLNPAGYHWLNLFLHIANALLLWAVLSRLKMAGAWFASVIFAIHPVQVESVAWISELKNVLMGLFFLLTLLTWIEFVDRETGRRWIWYILALVLFFLALSAKATACTLPAALLLILWLKKRPLGWNNLMPILPFVALALGFGSLVVWWEKYHQGTRVLTPLAPIERLLVASRAVWFYLEKIVWPSDLTFIYPRWSVDPHDARNYLWLVAGLGACVAIYFARRRSGRSLEVAALFFVATLTPLLGFVMLYTFRYTFVADHYQYLASIGPIALIVATLVSVGRWSKSWRLVTIGGGATALCALSVLTWRHAQDFQDAETLWQATLAKNPSCWMAYNNLGTSKLARGEIDQASADFERSISLYHDQPEGHYNLSTALLAKGDLDAAIAECQTAISLQPDEPDVHVVLGNALLGKNKVDEAIDEYRKALQLRPDDRPAQNNLKIALQRKGQR